MLVPFSCLDPNQIRYAGAKTSPDIYNGRRCHRTFFRGAALFAHLVSRPLNPSISLFQFTRQPASAPSNEISLKRRDTEHPCSPLAGSRVHVTGSSSIVFLPCPLRIVTSSRFLRNAGTGKAKLLSFIFCFDLPSQTPLHTHTNPPRIEVVQSELSRACNGLSLAKEKHFSHDVGSACVLIHITAAAAAAVAATATSTSTSPIVRGFKHSAGQTGEVHLHLKGITVYTRNILQTNIASFAGGTQHNDCRQPAA